MTRPVHLSLALWLAFAVGGQGVASAQVVTVVPLDGVPLDAVATDGAAVASTAADAASGQSVTSTGVDPAASLREDLGFLASDELRGRSVEDDSIDVAADYIARRMSEIGLDTTAVAGSPLQPFDVVLGARPAEADRNSLVLTTPGSIVETKDKDGESLGSEGESVLALGSAFTPLAVGSPSGEVSGPMVFAGYGITAPKLDYDDYQNIDANGAIVIVLRKEPQLNDPESRFQGTRNTQHAFFSTKISNAIKQGASAVILVNDPQSVQQAIDNVRAKITREEQRRDNVNRQLAELPEEAANSRAKLNESLERIDQSIAALEQELEQAERGLLGISEAGRKEEGTPSIPVVSVARDVIDGWLQRFAGRTLEQVEREIDETGSPRSAVLDGAIASIAIELEPLKNKTSNVMGVLAGKGDLADQTVVIGAHYDHVGMGGIGSLAPGTIAVHNGADDNASGTTVLLALAERLKASLASKESHRRILFIAFTGEERGLLGSRHYVRNPRFPLDSTVAMVNLDMVGRLRDNELTVYGTGSSLSFDALVDRINQQQPEPFQLFKVASGYGPSDHQSFYEAGVPVLFFFTGLHSDYHRPSDDFDKIEFGGLSRITDIVSDVAFELAIRHDRPEYAETDKRVRIRRQMTAFLGVSLSNRQDHVTISGVVDGGPAQQAGIEPGDRLEKLGDQRVRTAYEVIEWVRSRSPGDRATATVRRGGRSIELTVELAKRPE